MLDPFRDSGTTLISAERDTHIDRSACFSGKFGRKLSRPCGEHAMAMHSNEEVRLPATTGTPAAQYVRMSTDHQRYSIDNQKDAIESYATSHGLRIVRSYEDAGRSGLSLHQRDGLRALLHDVLSNEAPFNVLVIYDVSRWGRFQDADESAHYEYLCRRAGVQIIYCAEPFENDGSPMATIFKSIKRAMAGEYSRELGNKVMLGQRRLAERGFRMGGPSPYGLRRMRVDDEGNRFDILKKGEQKALHTDRIILVPGPPEEVHRVRAIFRLFAITGLSVPSIARQLNADGIKSPGGTTWRAGAVTRILTNEHYIGNAIWNRYASRLTPNRVPNPPEEWVRADGVTSPVVDPAQFWRTQEIMGGRVRRRSNEQLLEELRELFEREGRLTERMIGDEVGMASATAYRQRFGSLVKAFELVGYRPRKNYDFVEKNKRIRKFGLAFMDGLVTDLRSLKLRVKRLPRQIVKIAGNTTLQVRFSRYKSREGGGRNNWDANFTGRSCADLALIVRLMPDEDSVLDYFLLPSAVVRKKKIRLLRDGNGELEQYRLSSLDAVCGVLMAQNGRQKHC